MQEVLMSLNQDTTNQIGGEEVEKIDENDRIIKSIQMLRERGIADLMKNGELPKDIEDRALLIQLMNGATQTALGNKKIKVHAQQAANQAQTVKNLAEAVRIGMSIAQAGHRDLQIKRVVPKLEPKLVPHHTDIGTFPLSTTSIAAGGTGAMD